MEKNQPGSGQSTKTGGGIRFAHRSKHNIQMSLLSKDYWVNFSEEFGVNSNYRETGHLFLSLNDNNFLEFNQSTSSDNLNLKLLKISEIKSIWPPLSSLPSKNGIFALLEATLINTE